jgi:hypothetical protein
MATIGSLVFKIGADTAEILDGVNKVNAKLGTLPAELDRVQSKTSAWGSFVGNVMADVAAKVGDLAVKAIVELADRAEKVSSVGSAFDRLTGSVGETGEAFLRVSKTATKGLISDLDLMQAANKGILLGLPITSQSFSKLAETAIVLGRAMGQGPNQSLNDLITALGRSSPLILDNLGLTVKVGEANEKYAAKLGRTVEQLSDADKKMAFYNAAMDAAGRKVQELGGIHDRATDVITRVKVAWDNLLTKIGDAINKSPAVQAAFTAINEKIGEWVKVMEDGGPRFAGAINQAVINIAESMRGLLTAFNVVSTAWNEVQKKIAEGFKFGMESFAMIGPTLSAINPTLGEAAAKLMHTSGAYDYATRAATEFDKIAREQEADLKRNSDALSSVQGNLAGLIEKMKSATPAAAETSRAIRDNSAAADAFGKSIFDAVSKVGNGFDVIRNHTTKVDIKGVMDRSADAASNLAAVNTQQLQTSFFVVGKAAEDTARSIQSTTQQAMTMAQAVNGWGTSFTRGTLLTPGQGGFTIGVPQKPAQASTPWGSSMTGWQISSTGTPYYIGHSGGGIDWTGVRRFHSGGLMHDEQPIVAQTGEGILSRTGMATLAALNAGRGFGSGPSVEITINAQGAFFDTPDARERLATMVGQAVIAKLKSQGARVH